MTVVVVTTEFFSSERTAVSEAVLTSVLSFSAVDSICIVVEAISSVKEFVDAVSSSQSHSSIDQLEAVGLSNVLTITYSVNLFGK